MSIFIFYLPLVIYILRVLQSLGSCKALRIQLLCHQHWQGITRFPNACKQCLASSPLPGLLDLEVLLIIPHLIPSLATRAQLPPSLALVFRSAYGNVPFSTLQTCFYHGSRHLYSPFLIKLTLWISNQNFWWILYGEYKLNSKLIILHIISVYNVIKYI